MAITRIAQVDVGAGGAASIDFTSIPGTYTDLMIQFSGRPISGSINDWNVNFNGVSTNRLYRKLSGNGSTTTSDTSSQMRIGITPDTVFTPNTFGSYSVYIPNYTSTTTFKSMSADAVTENNGTQSFQEIIANLWSNNAAITNISIYSSGGMNLAQYSSATLYGISKSGASGATVA